MTYAPASLTALGSYWTRHGGVNLGIVGDTAHQATGTSYHLGKSQLTATAYSIQTARDKAGLTEAASAIDLGKIDGSFTGLREFSEWLVGRCRTNADGTSDIREVIYSPDGVRVLRWDRERGYFSPPQQEAGLSLSHLGHTHVSYYRDAEAQVSTIAPYFEALAMAVVYATPGRTRVQAKPGSPYYASPGDSHVQGTINAPAWFDEIVYAAHADGSVDTSWIGIDGLSPTDGAIPLRLGWLRSVNVAKREAIPEAAPPPDTITVGGTVYRKE